MNSKTNAKVEPMENGAERIRSFSELYERHADGINAEHQKLRDEAVAACHFKHDEFLVWKEDQNDKHSAWYVVLPTSTTVGSGDLLSFNAHFDDEVDEARARFVAVACTRALRGLLNPHDDQSKQWQAGFAAGVDSVATQPPQDERGQGRVIRSQSCRVCEGMGQWHDNEGDNDDYCNACNGTGRAEPAQPVALSTLTDEQIDASAAHHNGELDDGVWMFPRADFYRLVRALAASAPAQHAAPVPEQNYAECWVCGRPMDGKSEDDCHCFHRKELATPQPVAAEVARLREAAEAVLSNEEHAFSGGMRNYQKGSQTWQVYEDLRAALSGTGSDKSKKESGNG